MSVSTKQISPEREEFHKQLQQFLSQLPSPMVVFDIGKTHLHDYATMAAGHDYFTLDCDPNKLPDHRVDVEGVALGDSTFNMRCGALICNGVTEQCNNPSLLVRGCYDLLTPKGVALFGICGGGYPNYGERDRTRYTLHGARWLLHHANFKIVTEKVCERLGNPNPTYFYFMVLKP